MKKSIYRHCKDVWQKVPEETRNKIRSNVITRWIVRGVSAATIKTANHQEIYDEEYYRYVDETATLAAPLMSNFIYEHFKPDSMVDIGCGSGALLAEMVAKGVNGVGLEYSDRGIALCEKKGLRVLKFDIEQAKSLPIADNFDLATSFEVAEHLPEKLADRFVEILSVAAPYILITAATPGQGGLDHVNEQPHEYWIGKFSKNGCEYLTEESLKMRALWRSQGVARWYADNVMIFKRHP